MRMPDSLEVKTRLLWHLLYRMSCPIAVTEHGGRGVEGIADVFAVNRNRFTHEFEIKVARSDLMGELKTIRWLMDREGEAGSKVYKHCRYLKTAPPGDTGMRWGERPYEFSTIPSRFSFVVLADMKEEAREMLKGTPYGLLVYEGRYFSSIKKVEKIHNEKADAETIFGLAHKTSMEVENVRSQLLSKRKNEATQASPIAVSPETVLS